MMRKIREGFTVESISITLLILLLTIQILAAQLPAPDPTGTKHHNRWKDANGNELIFQSDEEIEFFLRNAAVVWMKSIPTGITCPQKVLLEMNGVRLHAIFRDVKIFKTKGPGRNGSPRLNFKDHCRYEVAAYRLSKLLGTVRVPPAVERKINGVKGVLQIWVEDTFMEKDRAEKDLTPPHPWHWAMQMQLMKLFDALICNEDRNAGNILIDRNWDFWLIDHTRSFRIDAIPDLVDNIQYCPRDLWRRLRNLDQQTLQGHLQGILSDGEIEAVNKRKNAIIGHLEQRISENGANRVLFDFYAAN